LEALAMLVLWLILAAIVVGVIVLVRLGDRLEVRLGRIEDRLLKIEAYTVRIAMTALPAGSRLDFTKEPDGSYSTALYGPAPNLIKST
jgi:hypothetical protein